jgi:hypothetical protein
MRMPFFLSLFLLYTVVKVGFLLILPTFVFLFSVVDVDHDDDMLTSASTEDRSRRHIRLLRSTRVNAYCIHGWSKGQIVGFYRVGSGKDYQRATHGNIKAWKPMMRRGDVTGHQLIESTGVARRVNQCLDEEVSLGIDESTGEPRGERREKTWRMIKPLSCTDERIYCWNWIPSLKSAKESSGSYEKCSRVEGEALYRCPTLAALFGPTHAAIAPCAVLGPKGRAEGPLGIWSSSLQRRLTSDGAWGQFFALLVVLPHQEHVFASTRYSFFRSGGLCWQQTGALSFGRWLFVVRVAK